MRTCSAYQRERCVAAEMEACWAPTSSKASLPGYKPESDPFCPLAIARNFNQMQREASINGTQSLLDLRQPSAAINNKNTTRASSQRPQSSGGRFATTPPQALRGQMALPCLAGAALRHKDGGGLMATRQPPLRPSKELPSSTQISKASARRRAKERKMASTSNIRERVSMDSEPDRPATAELGSAEREEFAAKVARRDDVLQDVWLKMHSVEVFATTQGGGELAQLLNLYRSASLEIIEDMMQHPDLERVGDKHTAKKGEGMRSFRTALTQDADFADGIPEAIAWLGFPTRRNPLFLPPKGSAETANRPLSDIGLNSANSGDQLARLWDAQDFILLEKQPAPLGGNDGSVEFGGGSGDNAALKSGNNALGGGSGGRRRPNIRDRIRAMNTQLAGAQGTIRDLEENLRSLEGEREEDRERATRVRGAAREAGQRKMTQRMYRLRGDAAVLEEGIEELDGEITAVRVRLFAERLDVARKRMLKDALTAEMSAKAKARRGKAKEQNQPNSSSATGTNDTERPRGQQDTSVATIQARVRGMRARESLESEREARASRRRGSAGEEETDRRLACRGDNDDEEEEAAAVRIESAARGHLARKRAAEAAGTRGESRPTPPAAGRSSDDPAKNKAEGPNEVLGHDETAAAAATAPAPLPLDSLAQVEALGTVSVRAFFDYLGLGGCADRLRGGGGGGDGAIDGARLAKIARASDPDAELLAAGVCARLHRVKLLSVLGIGHGATTGSEEVAGVLDRGELASASASVGGVPCGERCRGSGCGGGCGGAPPVAAMAALHMVRQLRRELLPAAESTGPTDYGHGATDPRGASGGETEKLENRTAARSARESLVSELIPELEQVLSEQLRLSTQMHESRQYHAEGGGR
ncbi:unnamed protein product, partial [Ectocarpus sp. 4 AP-2014]